MSLPEDAIVTGFSYWHGKEKVAGRLTPRERALALSGETNLAPSEAENAQNSAPLDANWSQLAGQNVFRARLQAIVPKRDLRVEIKMVHPLRVEGRARLWHFPLASQTRDATLDWLKIRLETPDALQTTNNFGAQILGDEVLLKKYHFRPREEARVALKNATDELKTQISTEHAVRGDGAVSDDAFFALSLQNPDFARRETADLPTSNPQITGVSTFDVLPPVRISPTEIRIFGRYRGRGNATVAWVNRRAVIWMPPSSNSVNETPRLASALWAARKIELLQTSPSGAARGALISLSRSFHLATEWTRWLAIPAKARREMEARLVQIDLQNRGAQLGRIWAVEVENGRPFSEISLRARADLRALERSSRGRKYGFDEVSARSKAVKLRLSQLAREAMARRLGVGAPAADAQKRLQQLGSYSGNEISPLLQKAHSGLRRQQVAQIAANWQREIVGLRGGSPTARRLETQISTLQKRYGFGDDFRTPVYRKAAQQMAFSTLGEALAGRENAPRASKLRDAGERFARRLGQSFEREYFEGAVNAALQKEGELLILEIEAGREQSSEAADARNRIRVLQGVAPKLRGSLREKGTLEWQIDAAQRGLAQEIAYRLAQNTRRQPWDSKNQRDLRAQLERISARTEADSQEILEEQTRRVVAGEPLVTARAFRLAANGIQEEDEFHSTAPRVEPAWAKRLSDPLFSILLPRDTTFAELILPSSQRQNLRFDAQTGRFQARFYAPRTLRDDRVVLGVRFVSASGKTTRLTFNLAFDAATSKTQNLRLSAPGAALKWDLGVWSSRALQSLRADVPWQQKIPLLAQPNGRFGAQIEAPATWNGKKSRVAFDLTTKSGEPIGVVVDWNR